MSRPHSIQRPILAQIAAAIVVVAMGGSPALSQVEAETVPPPSAEELVERLGARDWTLREDAQSRLIELGTTAIAALIEGARSRNLEIAQRARFVLARIDPLRLRFRIVRVRLASSPEVVEVLDGESSDEEEIEIAPEQRGTSGLAVSYFIKTRPVPGERLHIRVEKGRRQSSYRLSLRDPLSTPDAVSILERGAETFYLETGSRLERERHPYVTLFVQERFRSSGTTGGGREGLFGSGPGELLPKLVAELRDQLETGEPAARAVAVEALGLLGDSHSLAAMRELSDAVARDESILARARLGDEDALALIRRLFDDTARMPPDGPPGIGEDRERDVAAFRDAGKRADLLVTEAALILARRGDAGGTRYLVSKLGGADPNVSNRIVACLADRLPFIEDPDDRQGILEKLADKDTVFQVSWTDPETEYFFRRALDLLSPEDAAHRSIADRLLAAFAEKISGSDPLSRTELAVFQRLWERIAEVFPGSDGATGLPGVGVSPDVLVSFLTGLRDQSIASDVCEWVARIHRYRPLPEATFEEIRSWIESGLRSENPASEGAASALLVNISRKLSFSEAQFGPLIDTLLLGHQVSNQSYRRTVISELARLTGRSEILVHARASRATSRPGDPDVTLVIRDWLAVPEAVRAAHEAHRHSWPRMAGDASLPGDVELVRLDVLVRPQEDGGGASTEVLDGRVLRVPLGTPVIYADRAGAVDKVKVDEVTSSSRGVAASSPTRYRLDGRMTVTEGIPLLSSPPSGAGRTGWYVTSESQLNPYASHSVSGVRVRRLTLIRRIAEDGGEATPSVDAGELWSHFMDAFRKAFDETRTDYEIRAALRVISELGLEQLHDDVRALFARRPSIFLAAELLEWGDEPARSFLRSRLEDGEMADRVLAAQTLVEHGDRDALRLLMKTLREQRRIAGVSQYAVLRSVDTFLREADATPAERNEILDVVIANLHVSGFQSMGFTILRREAGDDFGYLATLQLRNYQERREAQARAVDRARAWWRDETDRSFDATERK